MSKSENMETAEVKAAMAATLKSPLKTPYDHPAAGIGALTNSAKHLLREKALITGPLALMRMNQPDGFDCQRPGDQGLRSEEHTSELQSQR